MQGSIFDSEKLRNACCLQNGGLQGVSYLVQITPAYRTTVVSDVPLGAWPLGKAFLSTASSGGGMAQMLENQVAPSSSRAQSIASGRLIAAARPSRAS